MPQHNPYQGADQGRPDGIGQVVSPYLPVAVSQGPQGTDLLALLVHHTGQGGHNDERRHRVGRQGEHNGHAAEHLRIAAHHHGALVGVLSQDKGGG